MSSSVPWSREAEISVLGAVLLEPEVVDRLEDLSPEAFHHEGHRKVWRAARKLRSRGDVVDATTLSDQLKQAGVLEEIGGFSFLAELVDAPTSADNAEDYAEIVEEHHLRRRLIALGAELAREAREAPSGEAMDVLDRLERAVVNFSKGAARGTYVSAPEAVDGALDRIAEASNSDGCTTGLSTSFPELDRMTAGLQPANLLVLAGRPSMGKTALLLDLVRHVAFEEGVGAGIFSLEMDHVSLMMRMAAAESALPLGRLRSGDVREEEYRHLTEAAGKLKEAPIYIRDVPNLTLGGFRSEARRMVAREGVGLIAVDYLQLMTIRGTAESKRLEIEEVSRGLKSLAMELGVPVVALSQLSRAPESRPDGRPRLSDLRESGAIEQDADLVAFVYRSEIYQGANHEGRDLRGRAELIIAKQRNGPTGSVPLRFDKEQVSFRPDPTAGVTL